MNSTATANRKERGIALIVALLMLFLISTLAVSLMFMTNSEILTTGNYRQVTSARYAADYGAQAPANWIYYTYAPPASFAAVCTSTYPVTSNPACTGTTAVVLSGMTTGFPQDGMPAVTGNYSTVNSATQTAFSAAMNQQAVPGVSNATYSSTATLLTTRQITNAVTLQPDVLQTWLITSIGRLQNVHNADVEVTQTITRTGVPAAGYGMEATSTTCPAITLQGGAAIESYSSATGAKCTPTTVGNCQGNIAANGSVDIDSSSVYGSLSDPLASPTGSPNSYSCSSSPRRSNYGNGTLQDGNVHLNNQITATNPPDPSPTPPTTNQTVSSGNCASISGCSTPGGVCCTLAPGSYGNLSAGGNTVITLTAGIYGVNSLSVSPGTINVTGCGGSTTGCVTMRVQGAGTLPSGDAVNLQGGTNTNGGSYPANFVLTYTGTATILISSGNNTTAAVIDAPNAPINLQGGTSCSTCGFYGSIIGSTINAHPDTIYYDTQLSANTLTVGQWNQVSYSWSKF